MELELPGLIGAAIGVTLGYVDFRVVSGVVEGKLRRLDASSSVSDKAMFERKIRIMRILFFVLTVGVFPVIGYLLGQTVAGRT
jgi:hypothetical protein